MKKRIVILDYGLGNIRSAEQSIKKVGADNGFDLDVMVTNNPTEIKRSTHIILPGQGAFQACMNGLKKIPGMIDELSENVLYVKKPFLGICVGMQLLATTGYENVKCAGLGWIKGEIKKLPTKSLKLPHMGWNEVEIKEDQNNLIFDKHEKNYYFVHSYYFDCIEPENKIAVSNYGIEFTSIVSKENIFGVQFHP